VEPRGNRSPFLYIDVNRNGRFDIDEQFAFAGTRRHGARGELSLDLPAPAGGAFKQFPVRLVLPVRSYVITSVPPADRYLLQSLALYVTAKVRVGSRQFFFRYGVLPDDRNLDPTRTTHLVNEGRLNESHLSPSRARGNGEAPVFRIGSRYVSTESVDLDRRVVRLRTRDPHEYRRLELRPGLVIPDFTFEDLDGKPRQLSEFRGHYVLLNFWYPHCGPCVDELRHLQVAQEHYRSRGFTVVGLGTTGTATVLSNGFRLTSDSIKRFLGEHGISRVEATPFSVSRIVREWFMIEGSPTMILLDPRGRILSLNQSEEGRLPLRGAALLQTLDSVLPRKRDPRGDHVLPRGPKAEPAAHQAARRRFWRVAAHKFHGTALQDGAHRSAGRTLREASSK
jgi:peroxiredoxin